jgi:hypothetical protein
MGNTTRALAVAALLAACSKSGGDKKPDEPATKSPPKRTVDPGPPAPPDAIKALPPPPPEAYKGKLQVVNLLVGRDGKPQTVDVWALQTFTEGAVELAANLEVGHASDWFGVPEHHDVEVVPAGGGPDAKPLAGLFAPQDGEQDSDVLALGQDGTPSAGRTSFKAEKPAAGKGLVVLEAGAFQGHADAFKEPLGAWGYAFQVGDGKGCRAGRQPNMMLGGTSYVDYEVDPGKQTFALYKGDDYKCAQAPVYTMELDVPADGAVMVHVYTPDAKSVAHLVLPYAL